MPHVHLRTDQAVNETSAAALRGLLTDHLARHLQKKPAHCMVQIDGNCPLVMGDGTADCAFVDIRVKGNVKPSIAEAFFASLSKDLASCLHIPATHVYLSLLSYEDGAVMGHIG